MKVVLLLLLNTLACLLSSAVRVDIPGFDQTNEGNEFYVGFFRNRFGRVNEPEVIPPVLCITTRDPRRVRVDIFEIQQRIQRVFVVNGEITCVDIPLGLVVFDSTENSATDTQFKGIHIKAQGNRRIIVIGQHEEVASNDAYLALPLIPRPAGTSFEFIAASIFGDSGSASQAKDSVALIIGTENDTEIILEPRVPIPHPFAPADTGRQFVPGVPVQFRTVTIQRFQTFYLQLRGGDISGTRIIANKQISVFSGHECANVPLAIQPCDILIEQIPPIDTWGTEVVTVPLKTRSGDVLKVFASQDSTTVNVTYTDINSGTVTSDSFTLSRNGFRELGIASTGATGAIDDFALIQSNNPIAVFQFSRSFQTDDNIISDPFMLLVPPCEQYRDSYAVATAPFDPSIEGTIELRVAYVNYTNVVVPAEYFNASLITVNNNPINASEFKPIRGPDNIIWDYGAQLPLDGGVTVISHSDPNAALSVAMYGFSNQMSWGYTGGIGLAPLTIGIIQCSDARVVESAGTVVVQCERSGSLVSSVSFNIMTSDGTATVGNEYRTVTEEVTFGAGQSTVNITIPIIDDTIPQEPDRTFSVSIIPNPSIIPPDTDPMVTVVDDDGITVEFSDPLYTTLESTGMLQATLVSSLPLSTDYRVRVRFRSRTATRGDDFDDTALRILIPAGQTRVNFTVPVVIDSIFEGTEMFNMRLDTSPVPSNLMVEIGAQGMANGEIIDATRITVMFSNTTYSVDENAGPAQPVLVLSNPSSMEFTVQVTNTDGSATGGSAIGGGVDYVSGPYSVTFPAGTTMVPFDIPINNDMIFEGNENFMLTIDPNSLPAGGTVVVGSPDQATVTIVDNDPITVMFSDTTYSVIENNGPAQPVLVLSNPSSMEFTVEVTNTDGSATGGSTIGGGVDYVSGPYTVTFPAGVTRVPFNIPINDDNIYEISENFTLTINPSSLPTGVTPGDPDQATVTIVDDDPITVMFGNTTYSVDENAGPAQPVLVLSNPSSSDITVEVFNTDGSATGGSTIGGGVDYISGPYTVTFPAGMTRIPFNIPINDDNIREGSEDFMLTINPSSVPTGVTVGNPDQATVTIVDNDGIMVMFSQTTYNVTENAGPARPVLVLSNPSSMAFNVTVTNTDGSATGSEDYGSGPYIVTIPAGVTMFPFDIPITNDNIFEGLEDFILTIDSSTLPDDVSVGNPGQATVTIVDDDPITVMFSETTYSVNENAGPARPVLVLSNPSSMAFDVTVTNTDGSATGGGVDYGSGPYIVTFPAGATNVSFNVSINDDDILEGNEDFMLTIDPTSLPPTGVTVGSPDQATVTIVDNEGDITVRFSRPTYNVDEDDGPVQPVLVLSGSSSTAFNVTVTNTDRSATGGGVDYGSGPYIVTFPAGTTMAPFDIPINDDSIFEGNEDFILTIDPASLPDDVGVGTPNQATVTIVDNDPITVMFSETTYSVDENAGPARPVLVLSNPSSTAFNVTVTNTDGSATGGVDYGSGPYIVTIPAGVTRVPFDIPITDDNILEGSEDFMLTIDPSPLPTGVTPGDPDQATVTIVDNDHVTVRFANTTGTVTEGDGTVTIRIEKVGDADIPVTVTVTTSDGTATAGSDYGTDGDPNPPVITPITIPAGESSVDITVPILDDDCREDDETFNGELSVVSGQPRVTLGTPDQTVITIVDNDVSTIEFFNAPYTVVEGGGAYNVCLSITPACDVRTDVTIGTSPKDALPGSDYDPGTRTVTFAPNQMVACIDMNNIINDRAPEGQECFQLVIMVPPGSRLVPGGNANVTIIDGIIPPVGTFNDTVIGDPLYEVPMNMISNETFPVTTSLCYEIHGEAGQIFNLITDGCVQVNANYSAMNIPENGNIISQIGVLAYDTAGGCVEIMVDVNDCIPVVNGVPYADTAYDMNGVTARRRNSRARIAVPNCDNRPFDNLVFWVVCQDVGGQKMIKFQVARGSGLIPDSHGLIGQFWNIPVSVSDFTGNSLTNDSRVTPYIVRVNHPDDPPREFVAELFQRTWDKTMKPCLYAGDGQGGRILDPVTPNDPVIAGTFRDYRVPSLFSTNFIYNRLEQRNCFEVLTN